MPLDQAACDARGRRALPGRDDDAHAVVAAAPHGSAPGVHHEAYQEPEEKEEEEEDDEEDTEQGVGSILEAVKTSVWISLIVCGGEEPNQNAPTSAALQQQDRLNFFG